MMGSRFLFVPGDEPLRAELARVLSEAGAADVKVIDHPEQREERSPTLRQLQCTYAATVLGVTRGNKTRTAEVLGVDRKTLYRLLREGKT